MKVLMVLAWVSNRRVASLSNFWSSWHKNWIVGTVELLISVEFLKAQYLSVGPWY